MKPIRLTIAGLNSFRKKQEIDFTALTELGMFGIFGPTGSGKSSILDAITLALYGEVERAKNNTQGILNQAENRLEVSFDFAIGAGSRRKRYRVERAYKRGTGSFSVQNQTSRLLLLESSASGEDDGLVMVAERSNEVNAAIFKIIGLDKDDFTRAVVLPQGKFAEFLQLTGNERNKMMERLFGLEKYGQSLFSRANQRAIATKARRDQAVAAQKELGDASMEAVQRAQESMDASQVELERARQAREQAQERLREREQVHALMVELDATKAELRQLVAQADEVNDLRRSLAMHAKATAVSPLVAAWERANSEWRVAESAVADAERAESEALAALNQANAQRDAASRQRSEQEPRLLERRGQLREAEAWERALAEVRQKFEAAKVTHESVFAQEQEAERVRDRVATECKGLEDQSNEAQRTLAEHSITPHTREGLSALGSARQTWLAAKQDAANAASRLAERTRQLDKVQAQLGKLWGVEQELSVEQATLMQRQQDLSANEPKIKPALLQVLQEWLVRVEMKVDGVKALAQGIVTLEAQWQRMQQDHAARQRQLNKLKRSEAEAKQAFQNLQNEYEQYLLSNESAWVAVLRSKLVTDEPCPVCGATHHPDVTNAASDSSAALEVEWSAEQREALRQAEWALERASREVRDAELELGQSSAALELLREQIAMQKQQFTSGLAALADLWRPEVLLLIPGAAMPDVAGLDAAASTPTEPDAPVSDAPASDALAFWSRFVGDFQQALTTAKDEYAGWLENVTAIDKEVSATADKIREARNQVELAQGQVTMAANELRSQQDEVERLTRVWDDAKAGLLLALSRVGLATDLGQDRAVAALDGSGAQDDLAMAASLGDEAVSAMVEARLSQAKEDDRLAEEASQRQRQATQWLAEARGRLDREEERVRAAREERIRSESQLEQLRQSVQVQAAQLQQYTGGLPVADVIEQVTRSLQAMKDAADHADRMARDFLHFYDEARQMTVSAKATFREKQSVTSDHRSKLEEALAKNDFATPEAVRDAFLDDREVVEREGAVSGYDTAVETSKTRFAELEAKLSGRSVDAEMLKDAEQGKADADAAFQLAAEAFGSAKTNLDQLWERKGRWEALEVERAAADKLTTQLEAITKVLRGNDFVRYIASEQMDIVIRQASERLASLTRERYRLTLDVNGDFLMCDDHNGGTVRPVNTLSGGETFLTSLSLALALSAHIQLRGEHPLEFFFLDEGFGTLDPDLLDVVVSSLEKLNLERLSIGLISHVPELRQRIQRRLIVEPSQPAGEGTRIRLELA